MVSAKICAQIYKNRDIAVDLFVKAKGERILLQVLTWSLFSEEHFLKILMYMGDLILDQDERKRKFVCLRLNFIMAWDVLKGLEVSYLSESGRSHFEYILSLLDNYQEVSKINIFCIPLHSLNQFI